MGRKMKRYCFLVSEKWKAANQQNPWLRLRENLLFLSIFVVILMNEKSLFFKKKECWWKSSFMYDNILTLKHTCIRSLERASDQWTKSTNRRTQKTHIKCAFLITQPHKRSSLEFCMNCLVCSAIVCVYDAQIAWYTHSIWWEISIEVLPFQLLNGKFLIWYADIYKKMSTLYHISKNWSIRLWQSNLKYVTKFRSNSIHTAEWVESPGKINNIKCLIHCRLNFAHNHRQRYVFLCLCNNNGFDVGNFFGWYYLWVYHMCTCVCVKCLAFAKVTSSTNIMRWWVTRLGLHYVNGLW